VRGDALVGLIQHWPQRPLLRRAVDGDERNLDTWQFLPRAPAPLREVAQDIAAAGARVDVVGAAVVHQHPGCQREHYGVHHLQLVIRPGAPEGRASQTMLATYVIPFKLSVVVTGDVYLLEIEGLLTQG